MHIAGLDHLVLTVEDVERTVQFYTHVLGMELVTFGQGRKALRFGDQKINLHAKGAEISPHARQPVPGSADICLLTSTAMPQVLQELRLAGVPLAEEGIVQRTGAKGPIESVYLRDPDGNLIEISRYPSSP